MSDARVHARGCPVVEGLQSSSSNGQSRTGSVQAHCPSPPRVDTVRLSATNEGAWAGYEYKAAAKPPVSLAVMSPVSLAVPPRVRL